MISPLLLRQIRNPGLGLLAARMHTRPQINLVQVAASPNKTQQEVKRPISPHLSIYKPQLTSTLSIMHRATGAGVGLVLYAGAIGSLFTNQSFPELIAMVPHHPLISLTTTAIGGAIIYHTLNGVRHLIWDVGYGFKLKHLYMSGYVVIALTAAGTLLIAFR